ncbi:4'-phosphopantetheinyl transferase superfamily protein [Cupriavidus sp. CV2]|uniref:4'-phosphopantetheinyl transferase family protein n=1 Tax=Cupriavidus ulmosensis TaxID=3065913 RepID=UPI00296AB881|nr:4'-phosphopantetheinyl transferase superfamily protein [Cupriavidus sp. CV2]MDW3687936.1 4'-phosphopantetheinyl transferase superfamily protein [Cupriavidus sp. CV2]
MQHDIVIARNAGRTASPLLPDPSRLSLPERAVHVWVLNDALIDRVCSMLAHALSPDERQRARAYRHEKHRNNFIARRSLLRWLIGGYLTCNPESLRFSVTPFGKPALQWPHAARLAFSVSHTDGLTLLAFAWDCRVGVDVERRIDGLDVAGIGRGIFSPMEEEALDPRRPDSAATLLSIWTRKEALLKALGMGLSGEPNAYTTEDDLLIGEGRWCASHNGTTLSGWTCLDLVLGPEVRAALAVSLEDPSVTLQELVGRLGGVTQDGAHRPAYLPHLVRGVA